MTPREWQECRAVHALFDEVRERATERQWRLFACGCVRELGHLLPETAARRAFLTAERFADGLADAGELLRAHGAASAAFRDLLMPNYREKNACDGQSFDKLVCVHAALAEATMLGPGELIARKTVEAMRYRGGHDRDWSKRLEQLQCDMMREVFEREPRPLPTAWLAGAGRVAAGVARAIEEDRAFDELPVLADALEDADCPEVALVAHCREPGCHGRGCRAIDALLRPSGAETLGRGPVE